MGFCIDFRAQWLKSRHGCPLCDRYNVRKASDIDSLCENESVRSAVSTKFPKHLGIEKLEGIEYIMCSRPHGARSFEYVHEEGENGKVKAVFKGIDHLGWPELSALLQTGQFSDLAVEVNEQRMTFTFETEDIPPLPIEEVGITLVGYYLRLERTSDIDNKYAAL